MKQICFHYCIGTAASSGGGLSGDLELALYYYGTLQLPFLATIKRADEAENAC
jgi:hypothetical protein